MLGIRFLTVCALLIGHDELNNHLLLQNDGVEDLQLDIPVLHVDTDSGKPHLLLNSQFDFDPP